MNILVCIKAVPSSSEVNLDPETKTLIRSGIENVINPFDSYALELALRFKENHGDTITVLSMGIPDIKEILHHTYSLGVDKTILLTDRALAGADTLATSYSLSSAIKHIGDIDLILCGKQSTDGDTAQVGPEIAEFLNLPHLTYASDLKLASDKSYLVVKRRTSEKTQTIYIKLPALLTVVKGKFVPKLPTLEKYIQTLDKKVEIMTTKELELDSKRIGLDGSPTQVVNVYTPKNTNKNVVIKGTTDEKVDKLIEILNLQRSDN